MIKYNGTRTLNLTNLETLGLDGAPNEIPLLDTVNTFMRCLLAKLKSSSTLSALRNSVESIVIAENSISEDHVNINGVAVVIDITECDFKSIISLNTYYQTFDVKQTTKLSYFNEMKEYGEKLAFPQYDFFLLALKAMCTAGTRIGSLHSEPHTLSDWDYNEQNFLCLIKQITKKMSFTLEIDGHPHDVACKDNGTVTVNGDEIAKFSDLSGHIHLIMLAIYHRQPK